MSLNFSETLSLEPILVLIRPLTRYTVIKTEKTTKSLVTHAKTRNIKLIYEIRVLRYWFIVKNRYLFPLDYIWRITQGTVECESYTDVYSKLYRVPLYPSTHRLCGINLQHLNILISSLSYVCKLQISITHAFKYLSWKIVAVLYRFLSSNYNQNSIYEEN